MSSALSRMDYSTDGITLPKEHENRYTIENIPPGGSGVRLGRKQQFVEEVLNQEEM